MNSQQLWSPSENLHKMKPMKIPMDYGAPLLAEDLLVADSYLLGIKS